MKHRPDAHSILQQRLKQVDRQTHVARYQLQRKVKMALGPLDIQETRGVSQVQGDVLLMNLATDPAFMTMNRIFKFKFWHTHHIKNGKKFRIQGTVPVA